LEGKENITITMKNRGIFYIL